MIDNDDRRAFVGDELLFANGRTHLIDGAEANGGDSPKRDIWHCKNCIPLACLYLYLAHSCIHIASSAHFNNTTLSQSLHKERTFVASYSEVFFHSLISSPLPPQLCPHLAASPLLLSPFVVLMRFCTIAFAKRMMATFFWRMHVRVHICRYVCTFGCRYEYLSACTHAHIIYACIRNAWSCTDSCMYVYLMRVCERYV